MGFVRDFETTRWRVRHPRLLGLGALALLLACAGADGPPRGEGRPGRRPIPDPPRQGTPWTPPETKLPRFLVSATDALFAQGVADPRGCEYREVKPAPSSRSLWWGDIRPGPVHAFLLPVAAGDDRRFAVGWDGILMRVVEVGPEADLAGDVNARAEALRKGREASGRARYHGSGALFWPTGPMEKGGVTELVSPLQVCLLLRLGRADLAERLFAAATPWTPDGPRPDLTDYGFSYLTLANEWANTLYVRGVDAHGRGDDGPALDAFRRVAAFCKRAGTKAAEMGFPLSRQFSPRGKDRTTYFPSLHQLDELLADQERRAAEPPRGPIPGRDADPAARVAALILDLDQIAEHQMSSPGAANPGDSPLVRDLIAMGDPAVEPLLNALVRDDRLTRSISYGRGMGRYRHVSPTLEAIIPALDRLMRTSVPGVTYEMRYQLDGGARRALAAAYRKHWEANRAVPVVERYYRVLADDTAADRWQEAANGLASPAPDASGRPRYTLRGRPPLPPLGESIRGRRDPSVTALMLRRVEQLARGAEDGQNLLKACDLATTLARWDTPVSLAVLHTLMDRARELVAREDRIDSWSRQSLGRFIAKSTLTRLRAGDRAALDEYAAWIRTTTPAFLGDARLAAFEPMWTEPDHPAIAAAARALFVDPKSAWLPLKTLDRGVVHVGREAMEISPLLRVPAFREAVLAGLADQADAGVVRRQSDQPQSVSFELKGVQSGSFGAGIDLDELPVGEERPVRACDWLAYHLAMLDGTPRFELSWRKPRRDAAIAAIAAFLRRYGDRYAAAAPVERFSPFQGNALLTFPTLGRPATPADVAAGRAIFSLEGLGGEVRVVPLPEVPLRALWTTLEDTPVATEGFTGGGASRVRRGFDRSGRVWQAEEVRVGDRWDRYFGFVGPSTVGRAPAGQLEFTEAMHFTKPTGRKLDVRVMMANLPETPESGFRPGSPLVAIVNLRNRTGLDQTVPTEFLRLGPDGKAALRPGLSLKLTRSPIAPAVPTGGDAATRPPEELTPTRDARFRPGDAARPLGPAEAFEAFRLDLRDWFDLSRPGWYHLTVRFDDASGVGPIDAGEGYFRMGE